LALGIGANCAVFNLINAVFLRPLPYKDGDRLVRIHSLNPSLNISTSDVSPLDFTDWRSQCKSFEYVAAFLIGGSIIKVEDETERVQAAGVTADFFPLFGVNPIAGRHFLPEEDKPQSNGAAILSYKLWTRLFSADPHVIGRFISLNGRSVVIVGVMPQGFSYPAGTELWASLRLDDDYPRSNRFLQVAGRLKGTASLESAQAEIDSISVRLAQEYPKTNQGWKVELILLKQWGVSATRRALLILFGAALCVWLIACANISSLMLARSFDRRREMALRAALGAGRLRLAKLLLTECLLFSVIGGVVGTLGGKIIVDVLLGINPPDLSQISASLSEAMGLTYALTVSVLTGIAFGLLPLADAINLNLNQELKQGAVASAGATRSIRRGILIAVEIALSLVLLVGSMLLLKSFAHLTEADLGFSYRNLLTMRIVVPNRSDAERLNFFREVGDKLRSRPGIQSVGMSLSLPLNGGGYYTKRAFIVQGRPLVDAEEAYATWRAIDPGYFETLGVRLLKGRFFSEQDKADTPQVAIINEMTAQRYWPGENPIGKHITLWRDETFSREIVGVVKNVKVGGMEDNPELEIYVPFAQKPQPGMSVIVRVAGDPMGMIPALRRAVREVDKNFPVYEFRTMEQILSRGLARRQFITVLVTLFSVISVSLAAIGIFGVVSFSVTRMTREIGVRLTLGARARDVCGLVLRRELPPILIGTGIGLVISFFLTRLLRAMLYEVSETDLTVFMMAPALLIIVALTACFAPAYRASAVNPLIALRSE